MKNNFINKNDLLCVNLLIHLIFYGGIILTSPPSSAACTLDVQVNCNPGNSEEPAAFFKTNESVAYYDINNSGDRCSGTLLNNTNYDNNHYHYFLTALHCRDGNSNASPIPNFANAVDPNYTQPDKPIVVFHWNNQTNPTQCTSNPLNQTTSGHVNAVAWSTASDFLLLRLEDDSPNNVSLNNFFHAGWDTTPWNSLNPVLTPVVGIHHPLSLPKQISTSTTVAGGSGGNNWIATWSSGVTQHGSSGSCLFESNHQRCIGQLSESFIVCPNVGSRTGTYGKFDVSWLGNNTNESQLKHWLDPLGKICPGNNCVYGINGDPHVTTINNQNYNFQGAGEYVVLRDSNGLEVQTRQTPITTTFTPGPDPYDGLATCVSLNTAVAARVGKNRVTYQPKLCYKQESKCCDAPDPDCLELRVNGKLTVVGQEGVMLDGGGHIETTNDKGGLKIDFPDETVLRITPSWWGAPENTWFFNVEAVRPSGIDSLDGDEDVLTIQSEKRQFSNAQIPHRRGSQTQGLMAAIPSDSWLPELPNGATVGPMPKPIDNSPQALEKALELRFEQLYHQFGEAWRVNAYTSLFDYAPGTSTETFTNRKWPQLKGSCQVPNKTPIPPPKPEDIPNLKKACEGILKQDKGITYRNCLFDVLTTGNTGFAKSYEETLSVRPGATKTDLSPIPKILFLAVNNITVTVTKTVISNSINPTGTVQMLLDGKTVGAPATLDPNGNAKLTVPSGLFGRHTISANYIPSPETGFLSSQSPLQSVTIISYWLLLLILILLLAVWLWKRFR
jgi:hypothetical protein